jgi:NAD(P)-dependent dehydrogenase (short-subunit alcohol dehydrogenase family)
LAVSQTLALLGARVLMVDNGCAVDGAPEDPAVTELAAARVPGSESLVLDVAAEGNGQVIVDAAIEAFGSVDLIIHAAGILGATDDAGHRRETLQQLFAVDVLAAAELFEAAMPRFRTQHAEGRLPGAIVSLISAEALYGDPELFAESVGKGALLSLTRSMSHRVASLGIGCNAVIPMAGTRQLDSDRKFCEERQAFHRAMRPLAPTSVANLIAWLCTPLAAGINGQVFMARGREILLFSQARPAESFFQSQLLEPDELAQSMKEIRRELTDDWTVPDAFGNDPVP